ncbi:UPF0586 protein [Smittium mucronatum]|uniref:UPF0586 protein n=1 Tax=Smittium mucronatum TaxID=133383 RepID=A0A1R0GWU6_9FUNG|nr:UPF0586 protein [Smittium mucronatum]
MESRNSDSEKHERSFDNKGYTSFASSMVLGEAATSFLFYKLYAQKVLVEDQLERIESLGIEDRLLRVDSILKQRDEEGLPPANPYSLEEMGSLLKEIAREWSSEGAEERALIYEPVKTALETHYYECGAVDSRKDVSIMVLGAGLGRLAFEIFNMGYTCQGNESSYKKKNLSR